MSNISETSRAPDLQKRPNTDIEQMKERFVRLLLGEDMTGHGNGVSTALALSNAITNLAASVFGKQNKLAPIPEDRKRKWRKEINWLLSVTDNIVEFTPGQQIAKDGSQMEIMVTQQRRDLLTGIPALKKLDAMLIDCLDNFTDQKGFWYVPEDADETIDKWWIPRVKLPPGGLSDESRKWMKHQKDCCNQVLKASMAINAQVLSEMEIPETYIDSLPKNGKTTLGDLIYKSITDESFDPGEFLKTMDTSSEQNIMELKNKIEASIVIWKRKMHQKDAKTSWSSIVSLERRELFEERAEIILLLIKQKFPGLPQSSLDISKIEYNKNIGHSILESYSRVLENLASNVMTHIEDVLNADEVAQNSSLGMIKKIQSIGSMSPRSTRALSLMKDRTPGHSPKGTPTLVMQLSDSKGWNFDHGDIESNGNGNSSPDHLTDDVENSKIKNKHVKTRKMSYIEKLEAYGLRSPTERH
ncbi:rho guanine nucleotide exchange factor 8-like [Rutidosis leptorrhynchoides]|uniref:rho guanine nucleotide exchange factor 8-like n=1 Tax=Rutidosis leptorrhynchoides TaxID=125765 RepID=UPI003A995084